MYPYFQKDTFLHAAESSSDPIRDFLSENPAFGTLLFQVTGGQGAYPVPKATAELSKNLNDRLGITLMLTTDENGKTLPVSLPAPAGSRSLVPGNGSVYASYQARISAPGYITTEIRDLPIFDGITTIQPVNLSPDFGQNTQKAEEIEDKEPDL